LERLRPWFKTRTGVLLHARLMKPTDAPLMVDFYHRLSPETLYRRFHTASDNLPLGVVMDGVAQLADVDNQAVSGAIVALLPPDKGRRPERRQQEELVGVVRLARSPRTPDSPDAEAAIVVRDDFHGMGVGQELTRRMVLLARRMKVQIIVAIFQPENEGAIRLFRELGLPYTLEHHHGETTMRITVPNGMEA
jgi:ribosomal protein S18 acetylase RimI-like enzyme